MDLRNTVLRLEKEWEEHGELIIAYDFDNTVYDYHGAGHNYEEVVHLLRECKEVGAYLIVFTAAEEERYGSIKAYLDKYDIPYDSINENKPGLPFKGRKIYYNVLLDDRAGLSDAYTSLKIAMQVVRARKGER